MKDKKVFCHKKGISVVLSKISEWWRSFISEGESEPVGFYIIAMGLNF
ncbi:hypothetical protein [Guptibacillus sedimenti]|nr:hypothetical protein [Pseudalkalibacillus sedimenti]